MQSAYLNQKFNEGKTALKAMLACAVLGTTKPQKGALMSHKQLEKHFGDKPRGIGF